MTSIGEGQTTGRWYLAPNHELEYALIDETFRTRITVESVAPEVTRVSRTRLELERLRDR